MLLVAVVSEGDGPRETRRLPARVEKPGRETLRRAHASTPGACYRATSAHSRPGAAKSSPADPPDTPVGRPPGAVWPLGPRSGPLGSETPQARRQAYRVFPASRPRAARAPSETGAGILMRAGNTPPETPLGNTPTGSPCRWSIEQVRVPIVRIVGEHRVVFVVQVRVRFTAKGALVRAFVNGVRFVLSHGVGRRPGRLPHRSPASRRAEQPRSSTAARRAGGAGRAGAR